MNSFLHEAVDTRCITRDIAGLLVPARVQTRLEANANHDLRGANKNGNVTVPADRLGGLSRAPSLQPL